MSRDRSRRQAATEEPRQPDAASGVRRGQLVVAMAVVVTVALVPVAAAYLQLGYAGDATVTRSGSADDAVRAVDLSVAAGARSVDGEYAWAARSSAVTDLRRTLAPRFDAVRTGVGPETVGVQLSYNRTDAARLAAESCPGGPGRRFGPCAADRGVVVQERAGETVIVGVSVDVRVTMPDRSVTVTYRSTPRAGS